MLCQKEINGNIYKHETMAPNLHATVKLLKQSTPIRPLINWKSVLTNELVKYLTETLCRYLTNCI
jgi:hypothetical protein